MSDIEFGDGGEAEAAGDEDIDWTHVDEVQAQIDGINAVTDPAARLTAAEAWAEELAR